MNKKRAFIIHGWEAVPESNWFPWLKGELGERGFEVKVPAMPNTYHPVCSEWLAYLKRIVGASDKNTYLVGHSLGVITILRYLEALPLEQKTGGALLVAGFPEPIGFDELDSFFTSSLNYEKIRNSTEKITAIHSDNDPYVPLKNGEILRDKLGAELVVVPGGDHLTCGKESMELPVVLESVLKLQAGN
jgi:hypothetical protein